tara:strand:+ start:52622 stop:52999 length:378 start_codon:yes stop_codon:yes gene_type:complete
LRRIRIICGDVNGDGIDDLIIGAAYADPNGNDFAGTSYVVFGGAGVGSTGIIELASLNGSNGFILNGINARERSGYSVSSAGDMNGDGIDDLVIGAPGGGTEWGYDCRRELCSLRRRRRWIDRGD